MQSSVPLLEECCPTVRVFSRRRATIYLSGSRYRRARVLQRDYQHRTWCVYLLC